MTDTFLLQKKDLIKFIFIFTTILLLQLWDENVNNTDRCHVYVDCPCNNVVMTSAVVSDV